MPKKHTLSGQFAEDIKGFENEYFFLKKLYEERGWSLSALRSVIKRFVEGWIYDRLDKVSFLYLPKKFRTSLGEDWRIL